jgi:hypothetical protein
MKQIDLERDRYRFASSRAHVLADKAWKRSVTAAAVWFVVVLCFGRYVEHDLPWYIIAMAAFAPAAILAYLIISLDDLNR